MPDENQTALYNIDIDKLEATGRTLALYLNKKHKTAVATIEAQAIEYWQTLTWMHKRPSMKNWTLKQLVERYQKTSAYHRIAIETTVLKTATK